MKRILALGALAALLTIGCLSDDSSPTSPVARPTMPSLGITSVTCDQVPDEGAIIRVVNTPDAWTVDLSNSPTTLSRIRNNSAVTWRDDPDLPGEQLYCQDPTVPVSWSVTVPSVTKCYFPPFHPCGGYANGTQPTLSGPSTGVGLLISSVNAGGRKDTTTFTVVP